METPTHELAQAAGTLATIQTVALLISGCGAVVSVGLAQALAADRFLLNTPTLPGALLGAVVVTALGLGLVVITRGLGRRISGLNTTPLPGVPEVPEALEVPEPPPASAERLLDHLPCDLHVLSTDGRVLASHHNIARARGYPRPDLGESSHLEGWMPPIGRTLVNARALPRALAGETVVLTPLNLRLRQSPGTGTQQVSISVVAKLVPIRAPESPDGDGRVELVVLLLEEDGERQRGLRHVRRAERIAAVGGLAAGLAHTLNNAMTSISMNHELLGELVHEAAPDDVDVSRLLGAMSSGLQYVQGVATTLAEIAVPSGEQATWTELDAVIERAVRSVSAGLAATTTIDVQSMDLPPVLGVAGRLQLVFESLLDNAVRACRDGGQITVRGGTRTDGAGWIEIEDTGVGISPEVQARMFEPFFTTRPHGEGTGLGLFLVQTVLEECAATLAFETAAGRGTRARVTLPSAHEDTIPPSDGAAWAVCGGRLVVVGPADLADELRALIPEAAEIDTVPSVEDLGPMADAHERYDLIVWDLDTCGAPDALPPVARAKTVIIGEGTLTRPLARAAVLDAMETPMWAACSPV